MLFRSPADIGKRVELRITTLSEQGSLIVDGSGHTLRTPAVPAPEIRDPTGAGDAFRGGFLTGIDSGLPVERAAQLGALVASLVLETTGTQDWTIAADAALGRLSDAYGRSAAVDIEPVFLAAQSVKGDRA